jgi:hypothetical protein
MRTSALFVVAISATNVALAVKFVSAPDGWAQSLGFNTTEIKEKRAVSPQHVTRALAPKRQQLKTRNPHIPNAKTIKIRYGPYTVPGARTYVHSLHITVSLSFPLFTTTPEFPLFESTPEVHPLQSLSTADMNTFTELVAKACLRTGLIRQLISRAQIA